VTEFAEIGSGRGAAFVVTTPAGLEPEARRELRRLLPGAGTRPLPLKGNILLLTDTDEAEAVALLAAAETLHVSRVVPVQRRVRASTDVACFPEIAQAAAGIGRIEAGQRFLVRCDRRGRHAWQSRDLERAVAGELERLTEGVGDYLAQPEWLVRVEVYQDAAFVGVNSPANVLRKKLHRQRKYAPGQRPLNRAQWKIREALAAFHIEIEAEARVLDLGSAPGGWAAVLAEAAREVVAVDPADLDAQVAALPNVRHMQCTAAEAAAQEVLVGPFDLVTCDMNVDPGEAADAMCDLAPLLKPEAPAIMTVKYVTRQRRRHEQEARRRLSEQFEQVRFRRLPHNRLETTAGMLRRRSVEGATN
jgi:tRNA(Ser,Leu) C12 N-acetylase TAN1